MDSNGQRLRLKDIELNQEADGNCRVRVTLTSKDKTFVGERSGANDDQSQIALAALAAIDAIATALSGDVKLDLKGINANEIFEGMNESLLVVVVSFNDGESESVMPGSCRNTGNNLEASVKATLDATNRIVEVHMK